MANEVKQDFLEKTVTAFTTIEENITVHCIWEYYSWEIIMCTCI